MTCASKKQISFFPYLVSLILYSRNMQFVDRSYLTSQLTILALCIHRALLKFIESDKTRSFLDRVTSRLFGICQEQHLPSAVSLSGQAFTLSALPAGHKVQAPLPKYISLHFFSWVSFNAACCNSQPIDSNSMHCFL